MLVFQDPLRQTDLPRGCVATIGNFDGMHVGHQQIVRGIVERGRELGRPSAVITFHPHPLSVVAPDRVPKQILTLPQKEELLREMGVDAMLVVPFTHEFSRWTADRFIEELLVNALDAKEVRIGRDFCFGAGREGNLERLNAAGERFGFEVRGVDDVKVRGIRGPARSCATRSPAAPCTSSTWPSAARTSSTAASPPAAVSGGRWDSPPSTSIRRTTSSRLVGCT